MPWATVSVKGKAIGDTPIHAYPLDEGIVRLELTNPETGRTATRKVRVKAGEQSFLKVDLR